MIQYHRFFGSLILTALDRRTVIILNEIRNCVRKASMTADVVVSNEHGYYNVA